MALRRSAVRTRYAPASVLSEKELRLGKPLGLPSRTFLHEAQRNVKREAATLKPARAEAGRVRVEQAPSSSPMLTFLHEAQRNVKKGGCHAEARQGGSGPRGGGRACVDEGLPPCHGVPPHDRVDFRPDGDVGTYKWPKHDWVWEAEFYRTHGVEIVSARARE